MNTLNKFALLTVLALTAGLAFAVQQLDLTSSSRVEANITGLVIGPRSLLVNDSEINANRLTRTLGGSITFDFVAGTIVCTDSTAITVRGVRAGDPCFVGAPTTAAANSTFTCFVSAADAVKVRHCPVGTAADPASSLYNVRVLSSASN